MLALENTSMSRMVLVLLLIDSEKLRIVLTLS